MSLSPDLCQKLRSSGLGIEHFPVVEMCLGEQSDILSWLDGMSLLLKAKVPFAIIVDGRPHDEDDAVRRERNLWFKREMASFKQYCRGFAQIETNPDRWQEQSDHAQKMSLAFGMPMELVTNHKDALTTAQGFLND